MINFLGFLIIICGFLAPFIRGWMMLSIFFFWVGFFLLFLPNRYFPKASGWLKWARIGLLLNVVWTFLVIIFAELVPPFSIYVVYILLGAFWISKPISSIFKILFPFNQVKMPDGSIIVGITSSFDTLTDFFDILVYIGIGIALGKLISKKHL
jgi:hypothetical protein